MKPTNLIIYITLWNQPVLNKFMALENYGSLEDRVRTLAWQAFIEYEWHVLTTAPRRLKGDQWDSCTSHVIESKMYTQVFVRYR